MDTWSSMDDRRSDHRHPLTPESIEELALIYAQEYRLPVDRDRSFTLADADMQMLVGFGTPDVRTSSRRWYFGPAIIGGSRCAYLSTYLNSHSSLWCDIVIMR